MTIFNNPNFDNHEDVIFTTERDSGLTAIIAIHDTTLGPALGGCRMRAYDNPAAAVTDVLRLARGMTNKAALAGLSFGGGKSVIIGDPKTDKTRDLMAAMGRAVDRLGGLYRVAEDVGIDVVDIETMRRQTRHVAGIEAGCSDPSPYTARGVHAGIRAAVSHRLGRQNLVGVRIAVQGLGHVGLRLVERLANDGAVLTVADIDDDRVRTAVARVDAVAVSQDSIHAADVDVFAPCALGGGLNDRTIPDLCCTVVAGAANNQLAEDRHGDALAARGILYAPDYATNAGGLIAIAFESIDPDGTIHYDRSAAEAKVDAIGATLTQLFRHADDAGISPARAADREAEHILGLARRKRTSAKRSQFAA